MEKKWISIEKIFWLDLHDKHVLSLSIIIVNMISLVDPIFQKNFLPCFIFDYNKQTGKITNVKDERTTLSFRWQIFYHEKSKTRQYGHQYWRIRPSLSSSSSWTCSDIDQGISPSLSWNGSLVCCQQQQQIIWIDIWYHHHYKRLSHLSWIISDIQYLFPIDNNIGDLFLLIQFFLIINVSFLIIIILITDWFFFNFKKTFWLLLIVLCVWCFTKTFFFNFFW